MVLLVEMFLNKFQKDFTNVYFNFYVIWWFEPNHFSLSTILQEGVVWIPSNFRFWLKPLLFKPFPYKGCTLLNSSSLIQTCVHHCEQLLQNDWLVIRTGIYIKWTMVGFFLRVVFYGK